VIITSVPRSLPDLSCTWRAGRFTLTDFRDDNFRSSNDFMKQSMKVGLPRPGVLHRALNIRVSKLKWHSWNPSGAARLTFGRLAPLVAGLAGKRFSAIFARANILFSSAT
jgi:hypothetical protein